MSYLGKGDFCIKRIQHSWHYETKHSKSKYAELKGQHHQEKVLFFKKSLTAQQHIFTKQKHENEAAVRVSFEISHALAKSAKPFTDG